MERVRRRYDFCVYGYVIMPEHVHLLLSEPKRGELSAAIKSIKLTASLRVHRMGGVKNSEPLWQKQYYDRNIRSYNDFVEKMRYIHRNPVKRGLCVNPGDWRWSSFRHYLTGERGVVEIESEWTARRRVHPAP